MCLAVEALELREVLRALPLVPLVVVGLVGRVPRARAHRVLERRERRVARRAAALHESTTAETALANRNPDASREDFHVLEEDGLWVTQPSERMLRFFAGLAAVAVALAAECPTDFSATFADMHDGDQKTVAISGAAMTITPANNNETWVIAAELDPVWCNATIDFNVPGKPSPPPVDLTATAVFGSSAALGDGMLLWEFTDPSGTLVAGEPLYPLNMWIQLP